MLLGHGPSYVGWSGQIYEALPASLCTVEPSLDAGMAQQCQQVALATLCMMSPKGEVALAPRLHCPYPYFLIHEVEFHEGLHAKEKKAAAAPAPGKDGERRAATLLDFVAQTYIPDMHGVAAGGDADMPPSKSVEPIPGCNMGFLTFSADRTHQAQYYLSAPLTTATLTAPDSSFRSYYDWLWGLMRPAFAETAPKPPEPAGRPPLPLADMVTNHSKPWINRSKLFNLPAVNYMGYAEQADTARALWAPRLSVLPQRPHPLKRPTLGHFVDTGTAKTSGKRGRSPTAAGGAGAPP